MFCRLCRVFAAIIVVSVVMGSPMAAVRSGLPGAGVAYAQSPAAEWSMAGANPQRTSWVTNQVRGTIYSNLRAEWYRPIEAYIPQNAQLVFGNGLVYVATSRGVYALRADTGAVAWRYDTELPIGNSPTVVGSVLYFGGYDRKLHCLDAMTGQHLWAFSGAGAGYNTNPLVVDGRVFAGNRDGYMYAVGAHGTGQQGQMLWRFQAGGPIMLSAAYKDGVVFFAANDNYAYAVSAATGNQVWKSAQLPSDGFQSFWPVIYGDKVIFSGATASLYRQELNPGSRSILDPYNEAYSAFNPIQKDALFYDKTSGGAIGPTVSLGDSWAQGRTVIDASRLTEYYENNPNADAHLHKPWRRSFFVLNTSDGSEYTMDTDGDGYREYAPVGWWGTRSGNRYPPIVGADGWLYVNNVLSVQDGSRWVIPQGRVTGWRMGTKYLTVEGAQGAVDEPQAISGAGNTIYRNLCCDRTGDWHSLDQPRTTGTLFDYTTTLATLAPGYDAMWTTFPDGGMYRLYGNYGDRNGIYHNHGDQSPIVPYGGRLYVHRSNAIIAFGTGTGPGRLSTLTAASVRDSVDTPTATVLQQALETQVRKIVDAGQLRPGYGSGTSHNYLQLGDYFKNPGDTLYTLSIAHPYLSSQLQGRVITYLRSQFATYFNPTMYAQIGWNEGAARESMVLPPEILASMSSIGKNTWAGCCQLSWQYPQNNLYALWKYAKLVPSDAGTAYNLAKSKLECPPRASSAELTALPFEWNAYIAGYIGFLNLQDLAGKSTQDAALRTTVTNELSRQLASRAANFAKDSPFDQTNYESRTMNISRNFLWMVPELGTYLYQNAFSTVNQAMTNYNSVGPYWFVSRYEAQATEGVQQNLFDYPALYQAKAYALKESRSTLTKYLDVPAFAVGDLFFIQNLVASLDAGAPPTVGPFSYAYLPFVGSNTR